MPEPIAETYVQIDYKSVRNAQDAVDQFGRRFQAVGRDVETHAERMHRAFTGVASVIGTIGVVKIGSDIINASTKLDNLNRMLVNVEGSQQKANIRFEEFRKLAKEPILDPMNLSRFYTGLKAMNVEGDMSIRFMKSFANVMAGAGGSNEGFTRSMEQVVQMMGKGKLEGQDLRVILESFPQFAKYVKEALGSINTEELAKKGITATEVMTKLTEVMEKQPHFAGGAQASIDNFKQSLELFEGAIGKTVLPTISKFLDRITDMLDAFGKLPESVQKALGVGAMGTLGGAGLLGLAGTLSFIVNQIGMATKGLAGLGAVSAGGAVAQAGAGLVATGVLNARGQMIMREAGAVGAGAAVGGLAKALPTLGAYIPQITVGTIVAGAISYGVAGWLGGKMGGKPATYVPSTEYRMGKAEQETEAGIAMRKLSPSTWDVSNAIMSAISTPLTTEEWLEFLKKNPSPGQPAFTDQYYGQPNVYGGLKPRPAVPTYEVPKYTNMPIMPTLQGALPGRGVVPPASEYAVQMYDMLNRQMYNAPSPELSANTAIRDQERIQKAMQDTVKDQESLNQKAKWGWDTWAKELEDTGFEMQKVKDEFDALVGKVDSRQMGQGAINFKNLWSDVLSDLTYKAQSFIDTLYQKPSPDDEAKTRKGVNSGFWGALSSGIEWITNMGAQFAVNYASGSLMPMAEGGSGIVTKPTMFLAGESGPERFSFQPMRGGSGSIGNTTINISMSFPNVDINSITEDEIYRLTRNKIIPALQRAGRSGAGQAVMYG